MGVLEKMVDDKGKHVFLLPNDRRIELDFDDIEAIFKGYRPRLISFADFKIISRIIKNEVKKHTEGDLIHLSKVDRDLWERYYNKGLVNKHSQKGYTYKKKKNVEEDRKAEAGS